MPAISDAKLKKTKSFKAKDYRAWNINDTVSSKKHPEEVQEKSSINNQPPPQIKNETLSEIDTNLVLNWEYHDRPETELGNIQAFAEEFKKLGQQQPCIVRQHRKFNDRFELIVGERRWRAAKLAGLPLKVIIKEMSDTDAAIAQAAENNNREDLSDYARGTSYEKFISSGIIKQRDLVEKLGVSKQYVSALLSFGKIPKSIQAAIGNMTYISAASAEKIKQLSEKGEDHINALMSISDTLQKGKIGPKKIETLIIRKLHGQPHEKNILRKIKTHGGHHIFTWRQDNNSLPSIHFPKEIGQMIQSGKISIQDLSQDISNVIEGKLNELD